jgi:HK97 family phage prohead protease
MTDIEIRPAADPVEVRSEDGKIVLSGVAIRYGARSRDLGGFHERIMPGAATEAIQKGDVLALHEHQLHNLLGRTSSGTLRLFDSPSELRYEVDIPDTQIGREVAHLVERRDIKGSSFGFRAQPSAVKWTKDENGLALRSVHGFRLLRDVSTTALPAYEDTAAAVALRSFAAETGLDVEPRSVLEAAEQGDLAQLLDGLVPGETPEGEEQPVIHRRPASWFI